MRKWLMSGLALVGSSAHAAPPPVRDLIAEFDAFATRTASVPAIERVTQFREAFGPKLPGIYARSTPKYDAKVATRLAEWPQQRVSILAARDRVVMAYAQGTRRFAKAFSDYRPEMPVYVIHSFGQMDGGTREVDGKVALVFGADVIAAIHAKESIAPFVDHELFHTYHARFFAADCAAVWCQLWSEGLATYVSTRMNPGATDSELLLTFPEPIRQPTEARFAEALCDTQANLDATDEAVTGRFFDGSNKMGPFPARFGYYVGLRLAEQIGKSASPSEMAHMPKAEARRRIDAALATLATCPTGAVQHQ